MGGRRARGRWRRLGGAQRPTVETMWLRTSAMSGGSTYTPLASSSSSSSSSACAAVAARSGSSSSSPSSSTTRERKSARRLSATLPSPPGPAAAASGGAAAQTCGLEHHRRRASTPLCLPVRRPHGLARLCTQGPRNCIACSEVPAPQGCTCCGTRLNVCRALDSLAQAAPQDTWLQCVLAVHANHSQVLIAAGASAACAQATSGRIRRCEVRHVTPQCLAGRSNGQAGGGRCRQMAVSPPPRRGTPAGQRSTQPAACTQPKRRGSTPSG